MNTRTRRSLVVMIGLIGLTSIESLAQSHWTRKTSMPTARTGLAACVVEGKIYAIGGGPRNQVLTAVVERYDPATDTWTKRASMQTPRTFFGADLANGKIYVVGGYGTGGVALASVEEYDPATDTWTNRASMPTARKFPSAVAVAGKIYVMGGLAASTSSLRTVEAYDPMADTWTKKADMPVGSGTVSCSAVDGVIYFPGGGPTGGTGTDRGVTTVHAYDPASDTWTAKAPMLTARGFFPTGVLNGKLYAIGGCIGAYDSSELSSVEAYDPAADKWWRMPSLQVKRKSLAAAVVNGKIYAIGGVANAGWDPALSTVEEYDPTPTLSLLPSGQNLRLFWNGILQATDTLDTPSWQDLNPPSYPWLINPNAAGPLKFYRARQP